MIENWKITAGTWAALDAEIIAVPQGLDHYVKPMISTITFEAMGYASILYLAGSATSVGTDYTKALAMSKVAGQDAYTWTGALDEGGFLFLVDRSDSTAVYGKASSEDALAYWETIAQAQSFSVSRAGYYTLTASLADMSLVRVEPLFLFGSATEGGWSLPDATPMTNITGSTLTWSGILSAGELKFLCEPDPMLAASMAHSIWLPKRTRLLTVQRVCSLPQTATLTKNGRFLLQECIRSVLISRSVLLLSPLMPISPSCPISRFGSVAMLRPMAGIRLSRNR